MKKRILCMLLALLMAVSLIPGPAFAAEEPAEPTLCEVCGNDPCTCESTGEDSGEDPAEPTVCETCGNDPCTCESVGEESGEDPAEPTVCETCGNDPCTCESVGEESGEDPAEPTLCEVCGNDPCTCETAGEDCGCELDDGVHYATCPYYICPECGVGPWHEVCPESETPEDPAGPVDFSGDVGKFAEFSAFSVEYGVLVSGDPETDDGVPFYYDEFGEGTVFHITDWYVDSIAGLWYRVEFCSGGVVEDSAEYWPAEAWILYSYLDDSDYEPALEFVPCPVCGKEVCTDEHILCDICGQYDCGLVHAYCGVCGTLDCPIAHIYCEICKSFDCGIEHEPLPREDFTPPTAPAIPENPQLPDGYDVAIVDGSGNSVSGEDGIILGWSEKSSLSAWSALGEDVSYQWQIFVNFDGGFWMDITGQTGKGLLFSRAMLMSALDSSGRTWLRCVTETEEDLLISDAVCVTLLPEYTDENPIAMTLRTFGNSAFASQGDVAPAAVGTVTVTIHYREAGGDEIAGMNPYKAIIPAGTAFNQTVLLPTRPGFAPFRDANGDGKIQTEDGYYDIAGQKFVDDGSGSQETAESTETVVLNLTAEQTNADTEYDVYYLPIKVNVAIRYFFQNIDDDGYTEETEYYYATHLRTGTVVTDAYLEARLAEQMGKPLVGFTRMVHNDEPVAADGSTVFECYYDRQYYMLHLSLVGGHGTEPVYARFGTPIEVPDPVRPGYTFEGWKLVDAKLEPGVYPSTIPANALPATIPAGSLYYAALWEAETGSSGYTVTYWIVDGAGDTNHADDTFIGSVIKDGTAGDLVSGVNDIAISAYLCGLEEHSHDSCSITCGNTEHTHTSACLKSSIAIGSEVSIGNDKNAINAANNAGGFDSSEIYLYFIQASSDVAQDRYWPKLYVAGKYYTITINNKNSISRAELENVVAGDGVTGRAFYTAYRYKINPDYLTCHHHSDICYDCGTIAHTHSDACIDEMAKFVDFVKADENVEVKGDGSAVVNVYYTYRTYTIRFIYARSSDSKYQIATLTRDGRLNNCQWTEVTENLPTFTDPSGKTERSSVEIDGDTYYYISLTAKFGANISAIWPSANIGNVGNYEWGSWAAAPGTGYREKDPEHANIVGPYPVMSADMIVDNPEKLADGSYLAQNMVAWWGGSGNNISPHAYHNYFEVLPGEDTTGAVLYNGKYYRLAETYTFTAAHNGSTRVDPIYFNGYKCINDTNKTDDDRQANSNNFANDGNCAICGTDCQYCNTFYYDRNIHTLYFWNYNGPLADGTGATVQYGASLVQYGQYVNAEYMKNHYPNDMEPNAYEFAGWYTTAGCYDGTEMDWSITMPDADMTVYAKWVPVNRTVIFFRYYESMEQWLNAPEGPARDAVAAQLKAEDRMVVTTVQHGQLVDEEVADRVLEDWIYDLGDDDSVQRVGFFYLKNGEKKAFSPQDIPVTDDLVLYAEWRGQDEHPWRVEYVLKNDHDTKVAATDWGYSRVGVLHTFFAKTGSQLYPGYTVGYFPVTPSHSMVMKAEENPDEATLNVYQFEYVQVTNVTYRVRYLEKGTNKVLHPEKEVSTTNAVVTESYEEISGDQKYVPDEFYKKLVLSVEEDGNGGYVGNDELNVITFYYEASTTLAPYAVHHMLQTLEVGYEEDFDRLENGIGTIGETVSIAPDMIDGFEPVRGVCGGNTISNGGPYTIPVTENGTELYIYYQRKSFDYKVYYYLEGTSTEILDHKEGSALYGATVTETADKYVNEQRYMLIGENSRSITIGSGQNQIIFYYRPIRYEAQYIAVPNEGGISNPNYDASEGEIPFNGSIPINNENYEFVGWFLDAECTHEVTEDKATIDAVTHRLTPKKLKDDKGDPITEYTFYAKFKLLAADFTITRTNAKPGQVFVYRVTDDNGLSIDVTIVGNGSVTIANLPYGKYTVTQLNDWSWRYDDGPQVVEHKEGGVFPTFGNASVVSRWLSGISNFLKNIFGVSHGGAG